ncbi:hypothetical protein BJ912DRAFT_961720 [Pholiota molesta]|nr:hypothetical protein BJ912DRAFT_961720 [Pholiota molesta]
MSNKATASSPPPAQKTSTQAPAAIPGGLASPPGDSTKDEKIQSTSDNLPPDRVSASLRTVSPPLSTYKQEVGGWWSLAVGKTPAQVNARAQGEYANIIDCNKDSTSNANGNVVEDRINVLAEALGMPSHDLASAIAGAVRAHVPPASLSSVAAKETGDAVNVLLGRVKESEEIAATMPETQTQADTSSGIVGGIFRGVESFAGISDEPTI